MGQVKFSTNLKRSLGISEKKEKSNLIVRRSSSIMRARAHVCVCKTTCNVCFFVVVFQRESVKSGHHCCPCQAPPPPVLVTTSPNARIIRQSSQPEASACCCSGCCCPLHTGAAPSAASLRQLREPGDGIAGIAADSLRINGGIRQFRQVSRDLHCFSRAYINAHNQLLMVQEYRNDDTPRSEFDLRRGAARFYLPFLDEQKEKKRIRVLHSRSYFPTK